MKKFNVILLFAIFSITIIVACRKEKNSDRPGIEVESSFFDRDPELDGYFSLVNDSLTDEFLLIKTIEKVRASDKQFHNIRSLNSRYGRANWDLSFVIKQKNGLKTLLIPFSKNNATTALLIAYQENARLTKFKLIDRKTRQTNFPKEAVPDPTRITPETMKNLFIASDKALEVSKQYKEERLQKNQVITITYTCTITTWSYLPPNSNEVVMGASYPQCTFTITMDGAPYEGFAPPDEAQWNYIEIESPNQIIIDSLNGYPCAQNILGSIPSVDAEITTLLTNVFNSNDTVNLIYKADPTLGKDDLMNGYTNNWSLNTNTFYEQSISLNAWVIQHSSREFIISTMLHEGLHAFMDYYWGRSLIHPADTSIFKEKFPIFWNVRRQISAQELAQHNEMANNYVQKISAFLRSYNTSLDTNMAKALAWKGLQFTTAWHNRSDTNQIKDLINIARRHIDSTSYSSYNLTKCD